MTTSIPRQIGLVVIACLTAGLGTTLSAENGAPPKFFLAPGEALQRAYLKDAEQGKAWAQFEVGYLYMSGKDGAQQDHAKARQWLIKSAEQDYSKAQFLLYPIYYEGLGIEKDRSEACRWLQKAVEKKKREPGHNLDSNQMAIAYFSLGQHFMVGDGVKLNVDEAFKSFYKSAELGHAPAQSQVGLFYGLGWSVKEDHKEAIKWYNKAAKQGELKALCMLGECYKEGRGVPQNFVEAHKWYNLATAVGNVSAKSALDSMEKASALNALRSRDELAKQMTADQIAEAQKRAEHFLTDLKR